MTAIVGLERSGCVLMGGDSAASDEYDSVQILADPKVFFVGPYLVGFAGSFETISILQYKFAPPAPSFDTARSIRSEFCESLRETLKNFDLKLENTELLVALRGSLYMIQSDYSAIRYRDGYTAIGSGASVALGSLHHSKSGADSGRKRVRQALEAAEEHTTSVRRPFKILSTKKGE